MSSKPKVLIVEDQVEYQKEIKNCLADAEFCNPEDVVGTVGTVESAVENLNANKEVIDLVLLDLNLPIASGDSSPTKQSGKRILDVTKTLNGTPGIAIKVIVVSGEEVVDNESQREMFQELYRDTLIAMVQKADLTETIQANLNLFFKDPIRDRLAKAKVDVLSDYDQVRSSTADIQTKLESACSIGIRLLRNEMDRTFGRLGASDEYADDLNGLIWNLSKDRFEANDRGKHYIVASKITSPGGWEAFLWRGSMEQHLQTLLRYRNDYAHLRSKPFRAEGANEWVISEDVLQSIESGHVVGQIVELIVLEILDWYLPWHEQVYNPWRDKIR